MKLLKTKRAYQRWAAQVNRGQPQSPIEPPVEFPCFAYLTVRSYGYEEDAANYLYESDLQSMKKQLLEGSQSELKGVE